MTDQNNYIEDILSQPASLNELLAHFSDENLAPLAARLKAGEFSSILISGMGSSYDAAYPAWLHLSAAGQRAALLPGAELLHHAAGQVKADSLLWLNSQSGRSAETVRLIEKTHPGCVLACVNDLSSPLALQADFVQPIWAGVEATVSTKTYINMLAANLLAAAQLVGGALEPVCAELRKSAGLMQAYLIDWQARLKQIENIPLQAGKTVLLGRGASMAAVWCGSLINKEAAKFMIEGLNSADFRHGPLELVEPGFSAILLGGDRQDQELNQVLAGDILDRGGQVIWVGSSAPALSGTASGRLTRLDIPTADELSRPLFEILPLQLLTIHLARQQGLQPGVFRHVTKITSTE